MKIIRQTGSHFDLGEEEARRLLADLLARPLFAHLATASDEGPRESPVWFLWEEGALWVIGNYRTDTFPRRVEREPRCAVGVVDFDPATGLVRHAGFRGRAGLTPHDPGRMERLLGLKHQTFTSMLQSRRQKLLPKRTPRQRRLRSIIKKDA